ncbi:hypothetical protein MBRU_14235 [Mycolicibacterium brumae DSM 44177]|nr:hypothetical protein MBRU_14235 [Mycolicibacterium brumae DSM 44177]
MGGTRGFLPAVEGLRACAAMGIVLTHVAFQTAAASGAGARALARFDLAVAVFFTLSGFLLWRGHAAAARGLRQRPPTMHYLRSRIVRIMPGYLVAVVVILSLMPDAAGASLTVWLANLTMTQIYVPLTLTAGLTQMWSLSVEVTFYLALPLLALAARQLPVRARVPAIVIVSLLSLGWGFLPIPHPDGLSPLNWPPAYLSWFGAGMLLAEMTVSRETWMHRLARRRGWMAVIALVTFAVATTPLAGPETMDRMVHHFTAHTAVGAILAWALLAPLVLDRPDTEHRILGSQTMVTLGRWSYGLFVWHLAALAMAFPMLGVFAFSGHFFPVLVLTLVFGFAMAAVSYGLVEQPCRQLLRNWERRRAQVPALDSSVDDTPEPATAH